MEASPLEARVRQRPGLAIIDLAGQIDATAGDALGHAYAEAEREPGSIVLLNFASIDYINSTGIALIVGILSQARRTNRRLMSTGLSSHFAEIFEITRLSDFMPMVADEAAALANVHGSVEDAVAR